MHQNKTKEEAQSMAVEMLKRQDFHGWSGS